MRSVSLGVDIERMVDVGDHEGKTVDRCYVRRTTGTTPRLAQKLVFCRMRTLMIYLCFTGMHSTNVHLIGGRLIGVYLTNVYLMGVCLLDVYLAGRVSHGRASHGRVSIGVCL
jgi:hypothetical protein